MVYIGEQYLVLLYCQKINSRLWYILENTISYFYIARKLIPASTRCGRTVSHTFILPENKFPLLLDVREQYLILLYCQKINSRFYPMSENIISYFYVTRKLIPASTRCRRTVSRTFMFPENKFPLMVYIGEHYLILLYCQKINSRF